VVPRCGCSITALRFPFWFVRCCRDFFSNVIGFSGWDVTASCTTRFTFRLPDLFPLHHTIPSPTGAGRWQLALTTNWTDLDVGSGWFYRLAAADVVGGDSAWFQPFRRWLCPLTTVAWVHAHWRYPLPRQALADGRGSGHGLRMVGLLYFCMPCACPVCLCSGGCSRPQGWTAGPRAAGVDAFPAHSATPWMGGLGYWRVPFPSSVSLHLPGGAWRAGRACAEPFHCGICSGAYGLALRMRTLSLFRHACCALCVLRLRAGGTVEVRGLRAFHSYHGRFCAGTRWFWRSRTLKTGERFVPHFAVITHCLLPVRHLCGGGGHLDILKHPVRDLAVYLPATCPTGRAAALCRCPAAHAPGYPLAFPSCPMHSPSPGAGSPQLFPAPTTRHFWFCRVWYGCAALQNVRFPTFRACCVRCPAFAAGDARPVGTRHARFLHLPENLRLPRLCWL